MRNTRALQLHAWSEQACPKYAPLNHSVSYDNSTADRTKCTSASVHARHLRSTTDLWLNSHPAHGLNGSGFEEAQFEERVLGIIAGHDPSVPLFLYYPMHLVRQHVHFAPDHDQSVCLRTMQVHSPLCVPSGYLEKFDFMRDRNDNVHHDRQYVSAMVAYHLQNIIMATDEKTLN